MTFMAKNPPKSKLLKQPGFAEGAGQPPYQSPLDGDDLPKITLPPYAPRTSPPPVRSKVGPGGRVVIPAAFREAAGMNEGADVMIVLDGQEVKLITPEAALTHMRERVAKLVPPGVSLADELLADRRAEVEAEEREERERAGQRGHETAKASKGSRR